MEEENGKQESGELLAGKFKSVDALVRAYGELEAEFTRRSQRLKALEGEGEKKGEAQPVMDGDALYEAAKQNGEVRSRIIGDYMQEIKGVPLLSGRGAGVTAPPQRPKTVKDAGALALSFLKNRNK